MASKSSAKSAPVATTEATPVLGLTLDTLRPATGAQRNKLRVGRGRSSGAGKTCNRGHNGEGQRSGRSSKRGFEGGQMPGYRRFPKLDGCRTVNRDEWLELNLNQLQGIVAKAGTSAITMDVLIEHRYLKRRHAGVRVLGNGDCPKGVTVEAHYVTPSAQEKISAAGGSVTLFAVTAAE